MAMISGSYGYLVHWSHAAMMVSGLSMLQEMLVRNCNCLCTTDMEWEGDGWDGGEVLRRVYIGGVLWSVYAGKC